MSVVFAVIINWIFGLIWLVVVVIGLVFSGQAFKRLSYCPQRTRSFDSYANRYHIAEQDQKIDWINPYMQSYLDKRDVLGLELSELDSTLAQEINSYADSSETNTNYLARATVFIVCQQNLRVIYLMDISEYAAIAKQYEDHQLFSGLVSVDNYEEVTEGMSESETSTLRTFVTRSLSDWAADHQIYIRRLNTVHYVMFGYQSAWKRRKLTSSVF
ncbi:hypothetical protein Pfo_030889 [Paulownia fortunei]|nr:hypothetical protein Pfo_030889 [Paulownia fortunei]